MTQNPDFTSAAALRALAGKSIEQARMAFDSFITATGKAHEASTQATTDKTLTYAEQNIAAALDFAISLINAHDSRQVLELQSAFIRRQLQAFGEQAVDTGITPPQT